ncbi:Olfactory receptor 5AC1 [Microtus ochrogaster]|uniref:Olfactory receptor 5AC1 n=1 Tax=Microtus ochrogaster TaxID=79684 RepID=A0A8J6KIB5_MICOH|nr:Olfactory receptor 5AC1 [Microtus ochrogaster]
MEGNRTLLTEFVLRGITDSPELQVPLFLVFFFIYVITMVGNLGLIFLIWKDPHLHTPMYLFLGNLAYSDACTSSSVTPKMLMKFINKNDMISLGDDYSLSLSSSKNSPILATPTMFSALLRPISILSNQCN